MRTRKLIKTFTFQEDDRAVVTLGPGTRLDPARHVATLSRDIRDRFSTDTDLYVKTRITNPTAVRAWLAMDAMVLHKVNEDHETVTSVGFRLSDGIDEFFWDGAWRPALAGEWNSENEISDAFSIFPTVTGVLQIVVNLRTSDARYAPELVNIKVLYEGIIEFQEDIIYRSLLPTLENGIRPITQFTINFNGSSSMNMADVRLDTGYDIVDIDAVFNVSADPNLRDNILQSYDEGTGTIHLTQAPAGEDTAWVRFVYKPTIAVTTSQDYIEKERLPGIAVKGIELRNTSENYQAEDGVRDKLRGTVTIVPAPLSGNLAMTLNIQVDKGVDLQRIADETKAFFQRTPLLRSTGLDEEYRLWLVDEFKSEGQPDQNEIHEMSATLMIVGVNYWLQDSREETLIRNLTPRFKI